MLRLLEIMKTTQHTLTTIVNHTLASSVGLVGGSASQDLPIGQAAKQTNSEMNHALDKSHDNESSTTSKKDSSSAAKSTHELVSPKIVPLHAAIDEVSEPNYPLHTDLLAFYSKHYAKDKSDFSKDKYLYLNQLLKSAIRNGDFLNLDSLIYITDRLLDKLPEETAAIFLSNYYECCGLFHFFEIDTPLALKEIRQVLEREPEESELYERCLKYLFSMLIATHLSGVAIEEMQKRLNGKFRNDPFFDIISILVAVEQHNSTEYVLSLIDNAKDRVQFNIKQNEGNVPQLKDYLLAINQLEAFIQHKPYISGVANLLPSNSEMILRIDLWIHAKQENKFYYNLLLQDTWLNRKQVF